MLAPMIRIIYLYCQYKIPVKMGALLLIEPGDMI